MRTRMARHSSVHSRDSCSCCCPALASLCSRASPLQPRQAPGLDPGPACIPALDLGQTCWPACRFFEGSSKHHAGHCLHTMSLGCPPSTSCPTLHSVPPPAAPSGAKRDCRPPAVAAAGGGICVRPSAFLRVLHLRRAGRRRLLFFAPLRTATVKRELPCPFLPSSQLLKWIPSFHAPSGGCLGPEPPPPPPRHTTVLILGVVTGCRMINIAVN